MFLVSSFGALFFSVVVGLSPADSVLFVLFSVLALLHKSCTSFSEKNNVLLRKFERKKQQFFVTKYP